MLGLAPWQLALGAFCGLMVGLTKAGLPGGAIFVVPTMVLLVGDARLSAAWLLPMLSTGDVLAVYHWRRHAHPRELLSMSPWVLAGLAAGALALSAPEYVLRWTVGAITLLMIAIHVARKRSSYQSRPAHPSPYGALAGFSSTVANAAGPVMTLYLLGRGLSKERFLGTFSWFFFFLNLAKVPVYVWHGMFTQRGLAFDALVAPAIVAGAVAGKWIALHIDQKAFETVVIILTVIATVALFR